MKQCWFDPSLEEINKAIAEEHRPICSSLITASLREDKIRRGLEQIIEHASHPHVRMLAELMMYRAR